MVREGAPLNGTRVSKAELLITCPPYIDARAQRDADAYMERLWSARVTANVQRRENYRALCALLKPSTT